MDERRQMGSAVPDMIVTPERAAFLRQRLKEKFAELQAAKADFPARCARLATEPRASFGKFAPSFEEVTAKPGEASLDHVEPGKDDK